LIICAKRLEDKANFCTEFVDVHSVIGEIHAINEQFALIDRLQLVDGPDQSGFPGT